MNINRRDFITACGAFAATNSLAKPVRGILGSGEEFEDAPIIDPTAADYVQNGLIANWDGLENIGYGEHSNNTSTWVDLAGNYDLVNNSGKSSGFWGDAWLENNTSNSSPSVFVAASAIPYITCEFVVEKSQGGLVCLPGTADNRIFTVYSSYAQFFNPYTETSEEFNGTGTMACIYGSGGAITPYANSKPLYRGTATNNWSYSRVAGKFGLFGNDKYRLYSMLGRLYAVRLYDRALSMSEIRYNNLIDQMRFGI